MTRLERFKAYADAFELTFVDDDWSRLAPFFVEDAEYQVSGLPAACLIRGREQIFRGMKKSLDGFDRRLAGREIRATAPPVEDDGRVTFVGFVRYEKDGVPPVELHATIVAEFEGDKIRRLHDTFAPDQREAYAWLARHGAGLDGSYV